MEYLCLKYQAHLFKWGADLGAPEVLFFVVSEEIVYTFHSFFQIHFGIYLYNWPLYRSFDQSIWFTVIFFRSNGVVFCSRCEFSLLNCHIYILPQFLQSWAESQKCTSSNLMENRDHVICLGSSVLFLYATPHEVCFFSHNNA